MGVDVTKTVRKIFISSATIQKKNSTEKYFRQNCQLNIYAYWWLQLNWQKRERTKHGDERVWAALRNQRNKCFLVECSCVHKSGQFITFDQNPSFCPLSVVIKYNTVDCGTKTKSTKNPPSTTSETSNFPKASVSFFVAERVYEHSTNANASMYSSSCFQCSSFAASRIELPHSTRQSHNIIPYYAHNENE